MKILVPIAGLPPARYSVEYIIRIARNLHADIVVLHVYTDSSPAPDAREAFDTFAEAAAGCGLSVQSRIQRGSVVETIVSVAEGSDFALIIMGASLGVSMEQWISYQVLHTSQLPVVVIPHALPTKGQVK